MPRLSNCKKPSAVGRPAARALAVCRSPSTLRRALVSSLQSKPQLLPSEQRLCEPIYFAARAKSARSDRRLICEVVGRRWLHRPGFGRTTTKQTHTGTVSV